MSFKNAFTVIQAGPLASLQDAGRFGVRQLGITQGGAIDIHAWAWANYLVGNPWGPAALEITLGGLKLQACADLQLALAGADLDASLNGKAIASWTAFQVHAGQTLTFGTPRNGLRAYLAVAGGFQGKPLLGSLSSVAREKLGGHHGDGQQLAVGDLLQVQQTAENAHAGSRQIPEREQPDYSQPALLEFILGAQAEHFSGVSLFEFFNHSWNIDNRSDRMGIRLNGPILKCAINNLVSEGLALGAVQVPPDGQPIVLLNDRQTIGGYPRLGTLTPLACARLAQCLPGQQVRFKPIPIERAYQQHLKFLKQMGHS
ncbi:MAG TPA: biotin-dependent carboxyltransferase family protein [Thiopseudomonas sp.]|nr:biotin-dependent carboxyltransferase family protein [Thiopseudomonas sp.]